MDSGYGSVMYVTDLKMSTIQKLFVKATNTHLLLVRSSAVTRLETNILNANTRTGFAA